MKNFIDDDSKFYPAVLLCAFISALLIAFVLFMPNAHASPGDCFGSVTCKEFEEFKVCSNRYQSCWFRLDGTLIACAARPVRDER